MGNEDIDDKELPKVFSNKNDQDQFEYIFHAVDAANSCNLNRDILIEIAAFSTGEWVECKGSNCSNQISILKGEEMLTKKWNVECGQFCKECIDDTARKRFTSTYNAEIKNSWQCS